MSDDIVQTIRAHGIKLHTSSMTTYKCICPWHKESTPSLMVYPDRQFFRCLGCGKGGRAEDFDRMMAESERAE